MRIQRLHLERFGHFTDQEFDFGNGGDRPDFHIIYGPNEAGKTTTMEAALRLFYGFPLREAYAFKHQRNNLQVSATFDIEGAARRFTRLPKRIGSLVDETGTALPEAALSAHLAGLSEGDYRQLLCLDDETIERGGEEIANAQGDIGRLLFSAAAGVADLSGVLDGVRDEANSIWKKRGRTTRIAELKHALADVEKEIREKDVTAGAWKGLKKALTQAQEYEQAARKSRDVLNISKAQIAGQQRALPLMAEISTLEKSTATYSEYPDQLDFDPERLIELRTDHGTASQNIERLTMEITALKNELDEITLDKEQLELAVQLDALHDLSVRNRSAQLDLQRRQVEKDVAEEAMSSAALDLGVSPKADLQDLVLSQADISKLETAKEELRDAIASVANESREVADLKKKLEAAGDAVETNTGDTDDSPSISDVLVRFDVDRLAPAHAAALQAIGAAKTKARKALSALTFGTVVFEDVPTGVSSMIQAQSWAAEHEKISQTIHNTIDKRDNHQEDLATRIAQGKVLTAGGAVVTDAETEVLLTAREDLWAEHQAALESQTASAFYEAMQKHDKAMDARVTHASELGQLRQIEQAEVEAQIRLEQADKRLEVLDKELTALDAAVGAAARQAGLTSTITSAEWLDWVARNSTATEDAQALFAAREEHQPILDRAEDLRAELSRLLTFEATDVASALTVARQVAEGERKQSENEARAQETLQQAKRNLRKREERHQAALSVEAEARNAWYTLILEMLGDRIAPENLQASLEPLRELREHAKTRASAAQRVASMKVDQERFAEEVAALAKAYNLETLETAAETFSALKTLSDRARSAHEAVEKLTGDIKEAEARKSKNSEKLREIKQAIEAIASGFPYSTSLTEIDELRTVVKRAQQVIEERAALVKLQRTVVSELGVNDIKAAREEMAALSLTDLEAAFENSKSDLERAEEELTQAIEIRVAAEQGVAQVTGDADIATLVEQKATLELQLEDSALEHLELSLGHYLASNSIRRYRDSHRSGMMTATERCFASLTQGAYPSLITQVDKDAEVLLAVDCTGASKRAAEMSKGTRFQLYLALRAAAHEQLVAQGTRLPFFCDDIFETFDEDRTSAACRVMETIGSRGQAIYLTHHRHVVDIAMKVCDTPPVIHEI
ncbi:hypothetical protein OAN307_c11130 [Octadecabacter antarcticus 307]|uniref:YhaN AAA domain-containing protein n=1 Tax=Octadecabacter antarcticus 307 TaxID=391626 RepID=M9R909_9RHOB|nr:YhaN family protein [Octadecabacter antarcticus]AGI66816.1 hypothetical protein OAN307_c11130 [Octadecabacter antarcticus 307]